MSARTPFNPTRPAAAGPAGDATANANQQFQPDPSNPLHSDPPAPTNQKNKNPRASLGNGTSAPMPLNVASLKPKKRPNTPNSGNKPTSHSASRPVEQAQARPATADPSAQQHKTLTNHRLASRDSAHQSNALNLAVSSPRAAPPNTPGPILQSNANANVFKHPGLPASAAHDLSPEDAHIPSSMTPLQRFSGYNNGQPMEEDPFFSSRVEEYERRRSGGSAMVSPPMGDQSLLRRGPVRSKRNRMDADDIPAQTEYPTNPKRYKGNQMSMDGYDMPEEYDRPLDNLSSPRSHHSEYQDGPAHCSPAVPHRSRSRARRSQGPYAQQPQAAYAQQPQQAAYAQQAPVPPPAQPIGIDRLLGPETNAYVEANMATYEKLVKRWSDCTVDEWKAGAAELTKKYERLLEVAQKHMAAKLALFASFDQKVDQHNKVLENRSKVLASAKEKVEKEHGLTEIGGGFFGLGLAWDLVGWEALEVPNWTGRVCYDILGNQEGERDLWAQRRSGVFGKLHKHPRRARTQEELTACVRKGTSPLPRKENTLCV
ncbi:uncharacterized protein SCHCODRAFT_02502508 [Schizophyllum commune H4-8]|uniref:Expressed protein n=1 Tax=Schizophyllum commune (strain H4-8 / FGSC 9210) TaxID=578458 RepID=D8Q485_SCHCM|nr:uncharacterized protein SCHCODRAFT_02502508 [Schizophyllum commune H4-8]KAI5892722.1 hypothetical protein SCHCODRAFT_02502508 [Schizophyllum commune H4-8]